jgi:hypothetical protein
MLLEVIWSPIHYVGQAIDNGATGCSRGWVGQGYSNFTLKPRPNVWLVSDTERFNRGGHVSVLDTYITDPSHSVVRKSVSARVVPWLK